MSNSLNRFDRLYMTPFLILCEGKDAQLFIIEYLNSTPLMDDPRFSNDILVLDFGGINQLTNFLIGLRNMDGYENVKSILIIRDAEKDADSAIKSIKSSLYNSSLPIPDTCNIWQKENDISICYTLFPTCSSEMRNGTLEDLCIAIIFDNYLKEKEQDIDGFISSFIDKYEVKYPRIHKNRIHLYFSSTNEYVGMKIGEAAKVGAYDWASPLLNSLKHAIESGFEQ